jgi:hypothetical protein
MERDLKSQVTESAPQEANVPGAEAEMDRYGITRVPVDYFHYRQFRYTSLEDAVAQAKRDGTAGPESILPASDDEIAKYGIARVPIDYFNYKGFRYTNLKDAVVQAKRDELGN